MTGLLKWSGYRGALALPACFELPETGPRPCEPVIEQPCLDCLFRVAAKLRRLRCARTAKPISQRPEGPDLPTLEGADVRRACL